MEFFDKSFWKSFIASFIAFALVLAIALGLGAAYVDSKLGPINEVVSGLKTIVSTSVVQVEKLTGVLVEGTGKIDDKITNSKVWQKVFGEKEEPSAE